MAVTVYGAAYSTYTRSALIALTEKGAEHSLSEIDIFKPIPAEYLALQPWGKIPLIDHDGFHLYETCAILRYIDEVFPGPALQPSAPQDRARMMQVMGVIDSYAYKPMVVELFVQRAAMPKMGHDSDEAKIAAALPAVEKAADALASLKAAGTWFVGEAFSLADVHLSPVFAYLCATPEGRAIVEARPALAAWWTAAAERPSIAATRSPLEG